MQDSLIIVNLPNVYLKPNVAWAFVVPVVITSHKASGYFERSPSILAYDELSSLPQAVFWSWSIILAPIFLTMLFMINRYKRR